MHLLKTFLVIALVALTFGCAPKNQVLAIDSNHQKFLAQGYQQ